ncbi:Gag-pro-like protein [Cucumis melo var. makuwa]|uniref:Gag-pro-like protein n=1 Tax=Cucumis melo var. makuwa TaxID=1194695 RepID=A0A5A7V612_CUCMM|nr:Gag-pro-like protein [Cucumis melo var. makuwa]
MAIVPLEPFQPPYPKWCDLNTKCECHAGTVRPSTESCFLLKAKVQSLVKGEKLKFKKTEEESNVNQNPLSNYEGPAINDVDTFTERYKNKVRDVTTSMNTLFQILRGAGYLSPRFNNYEGEKFRCANEKQCLFHFEINYSIEDCCEFKNEIQKLMGAKILLVRQMSMQEIEVDIIIDASSNKETSNDTSITIVSGNTILPHSLVYQYPPKFKIRNRGTKVEGNIDDVIDSEVSIYNLEQNIEEDEYDISLELLRLIEQEEKKIVSYQETLKVINLGTPEEVKEV